MLCICRKDLFHPLSLIPRMRALELTIHQGRNSDSMQHNKGDKFRERKKKYGLKYYGLVCLICHLLCYSMVKYPLDVTSDASFDVH